MRATDDVESKRAQNDNRVIGAGRVVGDEAENNLEVPAIEKES